MELTKFKKIDVPNEVYSKYYWLGMYIGALIGKDFDVVYKIKNDNKLNDIVVGIEKYKMANDVGYNSKNKVVIVWP